MPIYFAHATSFCGAVWQPIVDSLDDFECVTWDFAGHGNGPVLDLPADWSRFGEQVLEETQPGGIAVGHSMGACALVMAQLADPERFRFLVLIEPIVFPGPHQRLDHPLSEVAAKRKKTFESREGALQNFRSRSAFAGWHTDALAGYVGCGLVGEDRVELACDPEVEADIYRASNDHSTWERLDEVDIPVLILSGAESDTIAPDFAKVQADRFVSAGVEVVPDAGHFLPMEKPALVADRVRRVAEAVGVEARSEAIER